MKKNAGIVAAIVIAITLIGPAGPSWAQAKKEVVDSFRVGKDVLEKKCKLCHSLRLPLAKVYDRDGWTASVKRMVTYGAPLDAAERNSVIGYLTGRSSFAQHCSTCHDAARVVPDDDKGRDWAELLKRMSTHLGELESKGLSKGITALSDETREEIAAFLTVILGGS